MTIEQGGLSRTGRHNNGMVDGHKVNLIIEAVLQDRKFQTSSLGATQNG